MTGDPAIGANATGASGLPQKVLMVTGYLWGGGAEWHLLNLTWTLRQMGIQADVAYVLAGQAGGEQVWRRHGIEPICLTKPTTWKQLGSRKYDLIHAHLFKGELAGALICRVLGLPLVITRHSLDWDNLPAWQRMVLSAAVHHRTSGLIAISDAVAAVSRAALGDRHVPVKVIPHGLAPELLQTKRTGTDVRKELRLEGRHLIGTAARLSPDKGLTDLLRAYQLARADLPDWHMLIAGDGPERPRLEDLARELGIADRVHFLGWRNDALDIVAALDIFALPSIREGFGLALLEAVTFGTAAIVSDLPSIRETAGDAAIYIPPNSPAQLAAALRQLAGQPDLRADLVARSKQQAGRFSAEAMARQTLGFYQATLKA